MFSLQTKRASVLLLIVQLFSTSFYKVHTTSLKQSLDSRWLETRLEKMSDPEKLLHGLSVKPGLNSDESRDTNNPLIPGSGEASGSSPGLIEDPGLNEKTQAELEDKDLNENKYEDILATESNPLEEGNQENDREESSMNSPRYMRKRRWSLFRDDLGKRRLGAFRDDLGKRGWGSFREDLGKKARNSFRDDLGKRRWNSFRDDLGKKWSSFRDDLGKRRWSSFRDDLGKKWSSFRDDLGKRKWSSFRDDLGKRVIKSRSSFRDDLGKRSMDLLEKEDDQMISR